MDIIILKEFNKDLKSIRIISKNQKKIILQKLKEIIPGKEHVHKLDEYKEEELFSYHFTIEVDLPNKKIANFRIIFKNFGNKNYFLMINERKQYINEHEDFYLELSKRVQNMKKSHRY